VVPVGARIDLMKDAVKISVLAGAIVFLNAMIGNLYPAAFLIDPFPGLLSSNIAPKM